MGTLQIFVEVMRRGSFAAVARDRDTDPSSISRAIAGLEEELGVRLFQRNTISSGIALNECALAGMGLALLPNWVIGKDLQNGKLVDVFPDFEVTPTDFNTAAWFVYPSKNRLPKKVRVFVDYLKKEIRDNPPWMR